MFKHDNLHSTTCLVKSLRINFVHGHEIRTSKEKEMVSWAILIYLDYYHPNVIRNETV